MKERKLKQKRKKENREKKKKKKMENERKSRSFGPFVKSCEMSGTENFSTSSHIDMNERSDMCVCLGMGGWGID